jgi:stage III sporulation protein AG
VVAEGASRLQVRFDLSRAVQTLLDLPASAVEVLPKQKGP